MIPNIDQLLLVCGLAVAAVAGIVWLLIKLPMRDEDDEEN